MKMSLVYFQPAKERELMKLCLKGTADVGEFLTILMQGVDPDIYGKVCQ